MDKKELFIQKAIVKHKGIYDYSSVEYKDSSTKIKIKCSTHGIFEKTPHKHLSGQGCQLCSKNEKSLSQRLSKDSFVERSNIAHNNKYDYTESIYTTNDKKVIIICSEHGSKFEQTPANHMMGKTGCKKCSKIKISDSLKLSKNSFVERSNIVHNNKYDYSESIYNGNDKKVTIICPDHGKFEQTPDSHMTGRGCRKCGVIKCSLQKRLSQDEFIEKSKIVHNNRYDYSKSIYATSNKKVIIICPDHGEFEQTPNSHIDGKGCKKCANSYIGDCLRKSNDDFILESSKKYNNKFDYSKVVYNTTHSKVIIICPDHGEFEQTPHDHLQKDNGGCRPCFLLEMEKYQFQSLTTEEFINKSKEIWGNKYDYTKSDYINAKTKVIIICPNHGEFEKTPDNFLRNKIGCPKCNLCGTSKNSMEWLNMIKVNYPELCTYYDKGEFCVPNTRYRVDGYDEKTNTIFEFHGDYWHGNPKIFQPNQINPSTKCTFGDLYSKTLNKRKILEDLGYKYVEVWENDWNTLKRIILKKQRSIKSNR